MSIKKKENSHNQSPTTIVQATCRNEYDDTKAAHNSKENVAYLEENENNLDEYIYIDVPFRRKSTGKTVKV